MNGAQELNERFTRLQRVARFIDVMDECNGGAGEEDEED